MNYWRFFFHQNCSTYWGDQFCCKINELLTFSLWSPFTFHDFLNFSTFCDFVFVTFSISISGTLWAPILEPRGSHLVRLRFVYLMGFLLVPFGSLFGSSDSLWFRVVPFWFPCSTFGFLPDTFGLLGLVLPLATQRLCNEGTTQYIYNSRNKTYFHVCC